MLDVVTVAGCCVAGRYSGYDSEQYGKAADQCECILGNRVGASLPGEFIILVTGSV